MKETTQRSSRTLATPGEDGASRGRLWFGLVGLTLTLGFTQVVWVYSTQGTLGATPQWVAYARSFAVIVFSVVVLSRIRLNRGSSLLNPVPVVLFLLGLYVLVISFLGDGGFSSATYVASYFVLALLAASLVQRRKDSDLGVLLSLRIIVWGSVLFAIVSPDYAFLAGGLRIDGLGLPGRLSGIVGDPNTLSFMAAMLLSASVWFRPRLWTGDVLFVLTVVVLGQSRFALLTTFAIMMVLLWRSRTALLAKLLLVCAILFALVSILYWFLPVSEEAVMGVDIFNSRPLIWHWGVENWLTNPLVGLGLAGYYDSLGFTTGFWVHAHSQLLQDLLIGGAVGAVAVLLVGFIMTIRAVRLLARDGNPVPVVTVASYIVFASIEVPFFFDSPNFRLLSVIVLFSIFALDVGNGDTERRQMGIGRPRPRRH